jgi:hypothetical protein
MTPKVLFWDLENSPNIIAAWDVYDTSAVWIEEEAHLLSFVAKWLDGPIIVKGLPDYPLYKKEPHNDRELAKDVRKLLHEADLVIAQNGDKFDVRKANAAFFKHGIPPPSPYETVDTLKQSRKNFYWPTYNLNDAVKRADVGEKIKTDKDLWRRCEAGDMTAWKSMLKYNKQDVIILEKYYLKLLPWIKNHPHFKDNKPDCPNCNSTNVQGRGQGFNKLGKVQRYQCMNCGAWYQDKYETSKSLS